MGIEARGLRTLGEIPRGSSKGKLGKQVLSNWVIHPVDEVRPRTLTHPLTLQDKLIRLQCVYSCRRCA